MQIKEVLAEINAVSRTTKDKISKLDIRLRFCRTLCQMKGDEKYERTDPEILQKFQTKV